MKDLLDNFFFWTTIIIISVLVGITTWVDQAKQYNVEMAKLGMCDLPVSGQQFTKWQKCE